MAAGNRMRGKEVAGGGGDGKATDGAVAGSRSLAGGFVIGAREDRGRRLLRWGTEAAAPEIGAKVQSKVLPRNTTYAAYMVFKLPGKFYGLDFPYQEASIAVGGSESTVTRQVCLQGYIDDEDQKHVLPGHYGIIRHPEGVPPGGEVVFPRRRDDGWMEVELGEFRNDGGGDDEVSMCLKDGHTGTMIGLLNPRRSKLVLWAIELRSKQRKTTILYD
ncbi:hypothetical protein BRADI_3g55000v3 [Brachypodium distachyon]|uniref:Uncharacterized protein n=1 Tax=Brachypodium distachyon TaxID=15368 RepID=I1IDS3_BRADI|nr:hypothetical protein BRADI_3g55000v3 [Brachypodium distachyon]